MIRRSHWIICLLLLTGLLWGQSERLAGVDQYLQKVMQDWQPPGMAVAIVHNDSLIFTKGYGVRELGKAEPVDENTLFSVASNTKAFTVTLLAMLVEEGRLSWKDRVIDHMPDFAMFDPFVTKDIRVKDLLTHNSGLALFGGDHLWIGNPKITRKELIHRLRYLVPEAPFRSEYHYNNLMFVTAGELYTAITGEKWEDGIQRRILEPLGMDGATLTVASLAQMPNVATPHEPVGGKLRAIPYEPIDQLSPAGGLNASVRQMVHWMRFNINGGKIGDRQLLDSDILREMQRIHNPIPISKNREALLGTQFLGYGFGWVIEDYQGHKLVSHSGGMSGMISLQLMVPAKKLGVMITTNIAPNSPIRPVGYRILDALLDLPEKDWSQIYLDRRSAFQKRQSEAEKALQEKRVKKTRPSLPLKQYAGSYSEPFSGAAKVRLQKDRLFFYYNERHQGYLDHWHYDTFRIDWINPIFDMPGKSFLTFALNKEGVPENLTVSFYGPITFARDKE